MMVWFKEKNQFLDSVISHRIRKAGCLITSMPKVNISSKIEVHSPTLPQFSLMCGCLGLTSDIRVKAWKGKSIYRQTSEGEASPVQVGPRESGLQPRNLFICQIWMEQTARTAWIKQVHCWVCYTHRFTTRSANTWVLKRGLTKVVCPPAAIKVCMSVHQSLKRTRSKPVNCFMVLAI